MVMPPGDEVKDGPFVLRLHKWGPEQFNLELSDFCEALISPTRELLLLRSYQHEAILLPLVTGKISSFDKDQSVRGNVEGLEESSSCSTQKTTVCLLDSSDNVPCTTQAIDSVSNVGSSSDCYTAISGIKSSAWGHWGDTYSDSKNSSYRELLVVSDFSSITVHTFLYPHANLEVNEQTSEGASLDGKWTKWGPTHGVENAGSPGSCSTRKIWLKSYLKEVNSADFAGNFLLRFPGKSILPHSAEVVSFNIFESTLTFLEFYSFYSPKEKKGSRVTSEQGSEALTSDCAPDQSSMDNNGRHDGMTYYCPKVFSNSSNCIIGLVLTLSEHPVFETCEEFLRNAKEVFVVIVKLYQWGMQWVCAVKPHSLYTAPEWADFQFTEDFLICLNSTGFICIWNVNTGSPVTSFDVLRDCGLIAKNDSKLDDPFLSRKQVSSVAIYGSEDEDNGTCKANMDGSSSRATFSSGKFRRILVSSHSSLLASIDEHGVIYVLCPDDYIYAKHCAINNLMATSQYSNIGMLDIWSIAGAEIGGPKVFPGPKKVQSLNASEPSLNDHSADANQMRQAFNKRVSKLSLLKAKTKNNQFC